MIDLDKLHEDLKDMSIPNNELVPWISVLSNELKAAREVVEAARNLLDNHEEASGVCGICLADGRGSHAEQLEAALTKLDEARRG
jgi:hypothetical protein